MNAFIVEPKTMHSTVCPSRASVPAGYFDCARMRERLCHHAGQWIGTPFAPHQRIMGAGVDCVNLVAGIYLQCDCLKSFAPPAYALDGGKHNNRSQLLEWLDAHPRFIRVAAESRTRTSRLLPQPGDVLCFKFRSQTEHHVGLKLLGPFFIHALAGRRVELCTLQDHTYARCLAAVYRPIATIASALHHH
jgi:cell wall-associated NlpC family hydrolase